MPNFNVTIQEKALNMGYFKGKTGLTLPANTGNMSKNREISVQAISDWCSQLQLSDLGGCAKALYLTLQDSHQADISYQERYEILSILRPTLKYINQALQKFYEDQEVLSDNQRPIADLVNALHFEMMNGYKLVIEEASKNLFYNHQIFLSAIQSAMSNCTIIIFYCYEQHRSPPKGIWLELHSLYYFAKQKRIDKKSLKKYTSWHCRFNTIADIYKHCLLFSISNPNHLRKSQIIQLSYAIELWAPLLVIKDNDKSDSCLYLVDLNQDAPPRYISLFEQSLEHCYFLDLTQVKERIAKLLSLYGSNNHEKVAKLFTASELALPIPHLEAINQSFRDVIKRVNERLTANGEMNVCLGIASCHWFASQLNSPMIGEDDQGALDVESINMDIAAKDPSLTEAKFVQYTSKLVNQSEKGYCLNWIEKVPPQLQTGEIIGIKIEQDNRSYWSIGAIRWLKNEGPLSTLVGVELLSKESMAVKARLSESTSSYFAPALVLPNESEKDFAMHVITPPLPFKTGNEVELEYKGQVYEAVLQKSISASASYHEFGLHFTLGQIEFPNNQIVMNTPNIADSLSHKAD